MLNLFQEKHFPFDAQQIVHDTSYTLDLLARFGLPIVSIMAGLDDRMRLMGHVRMRHDVDHYMENAVAMAELEHRLGIASTYFMLPPDGITKQRNYFGEIRGGRLHISDTFLKVSRHLQDMGHEVGLHNDFISFWIGTGMEPKDALDDILSKCRAAGLDIRGTAAHGSKLCHEHGYANSDVFAVARSVFTGDQLTISGRTLKLHNLELRDFDLDYEAGSLAHDVYVSDAGNRFYLDMKDGSRERTYLDRAMFQDNVVLRAAMSVGRPPIVHVLVHADHWSFRYAMGDVGISLCLHDIDEKYLETKFEAKHVILEHAGNVVYADIRNPRSEYNVKYNRETFKFSNQKAWASFPVLAMDGAVTSPHILELGCGQGDFLPLVAERLPADGERAVIGVDSSFAAVADAAAKYPNVSWVVDTGESFLDSLLTNAAELRRLPERYGLILDKTGFTNIDSFDEAYAVLKKISRCLAPGGRYVYLASAEFYALRYGDQEKWPMSWIEIAHRVFASARRLSEHPGIWAFSFGMDG